jgi:hypothetical protein
MLVVDRGCSEQVKRLELGSSFISFKISRWAKDYTLYLNWEKKNFRILFYFQISRSNPFLSLKDASDLEISFDERLCEQSSRPMYPWEKIHLVNPVFAFPLG